MIIKTIIAVIAYLILAPFVGGFLAGLDRKLSARMQRRVGPPVLQPFYDVFKLFEKEKQTVTRVQDYYILRRRRHAARDLHSHGSKCVPYHCGIFVKLALCAGGSGT